MQVRPVVQFAARLDSTSERIFLRMGITGAHHTSYTVRDLDEAIHFYRDLLGFELVLVRPEITHNYWRSVVGFPDAVARDALFKIPGTEHRLELVEYKHP